MLELKSKRRVFGDETLRSHTPTWQAIWSSAEADRIGDKHVALIERTLILAMRSKGGVHVRRDCR